MPISNGHSTSDWSQHAAPAAAASYEAGVGSVRESEEDALPRVGDAGSSEIAGDDRDHAPMNAALKSIEDYVRDNPMTVLVGTAVAGAVVAMALSRRSPRVEDRRWLRDLSRHTDDIQRNVAREVRSLMNEDRINRLVNSIPTAEVSKAVSPWLAQVIEAMSSAKSQAQKTVADTAQKVHDKLA